jgi:hypothetical protein
MSYMQGLREEIVEKRNQVDVWEICMELLPGDLSHVQGAYMSTNYIAVRLPASIAAFRDFRKSLGPDWVRIHRYQHYDGDMEIRYRHKSYPEAELLVWLITTADGATCHREPVGEKTTTLYRMVCQ